MHNFYRNRDASLRVRFNSVAEQYERLRLDYPPELYEDIFFHCAGIKTVLEIGTGTGKATEEFLKRRMTVTGIEPNSEMLRIAVRKFSGFENFLPVNSTFEDYSAPQFFDLVFAASSFQWLRREDRLNKISAVIKPLGWFVRFKTVTILNPDSLENEILYRLYEKLIPDYLPRNVTKSSTNEKSYTAAGFSDIFRSEYFNDVNFTRNDYLDFMNTYTEYLALDENLRREFENSIKTAVRPDASFKLQQKCSMIIARKTK